MDVSKGGFVMTDRFDLEQCIMKIFNTCEDLDVFLEQYYDRGTPMTEDEVYNYVFGIRNVLELRAEKLYDVHCKTFKIDHYREEPTIPAWMTQDDEEDDKPTIKKEAA
jgi:hypothetical protein